jgi:hypothetical protein
MCRRIAMLFTTLALLAAGTAYASAQAQVTKSNLKKVPLSAQEFVSCSNGGSGEIVDLEGYIHILSFQVQNQTKCHGIFMSPRSMLVLSEKQLELSTQ